MPRPPNPNSKTMNLVLAGKPGQEEKIRWFRRWCAMNGKEISEILYEKIEEHAEKHGYPDSHSQAPLFSLFSQEMESMYDKPKLLPLFLTCINSKKELSRGEFYCTKVNFWRPPKACDKCNDYREGGVVGGLH
jgi:hypothetical protein